MEIVQTSFKTTWIGDDPHGLAFVSRYIHCNSSQLGIRPENYRWSSCRNYLGRAPNPKWVNPTPVLETVSRNGLSAHGSYLQYLREAPRRRRKVMRGNEDGADFQVEFLRHIEERCIERLTTFKEVLGRHTIRKIVSWAELSVYGISPKVVAEFYGYESGRIVSAIASRFRTTLQVDPKLTFAMERIKRIPKPKC